MFHFARDDDAGCYILSHDTTELQFVLVRVLGRLSTQLDVDLVSQVHDRPAANGELKGYLHCIVLRLKGYLHLTVISVKHCP